MITIFTCPKPFRGATKVRQYNAVTSWKLLHSTIQVLLVGDEEGTSQASRDLGAAQISGVLRNEYGTPLVSSILSLASGRALYPLVCFVNADIVLTKRFLWCAERASRRWSRFLMVGQRWDLDVDQPINFGKPDWEERLVSRVSAEGRRMSADGIDYFLFPNRLYRDVPPFAMGRTCWDNWMVYQAHTQNVPIVSTSAFITAVHQNHDYSHHLEGAEGVWEGPEALRNRELAGGRYPIFTIEDANFRFRKNGVVKRQFILRRHLRRLMAVAIDLSPSWAQKLGMKAKGLLEGLKGPRVTTRV